MCFPGPNGWKVERPTNQWSSIIRNMSGIVQAAPPEWNRVQMGLRDQAEDKVPGSGQLENWTEFSAVFFAPLTDP